MLNAWVHRPEPDKRHLSRSRKRPGVSIRNVSPYPIVSGAAVMVGREPLSKYGAGKYLSLPHRGLGARSVSSRLDDATVWQQQRCRMVSAIHSRARPRRPRLSRQDPRPPRCRRGSSDRRIQVRHLLPPVASTRPSGNSVRLSCFRGVAIEPTYRQEGVALLRSITSAVAVMLLQLSPRTLGHCAPPARRTFPGSYMTAEPHWRLPYQVPVAPNWVSPTTLQAPDTEVSR